MSFAITHNGFLGDRERDFALTSTMLAELERKTGLGVIELFRRIGAQTFTASEMVEVIRFALVGAGTDPVEASRLVRVYVEDRPIMEVIGLAFSILDVRINGRAPVEPAPEPQATPVPAEPEPAPVADLPSHPGIGSE